MFGAVKAIVTGGGKGSGTIGSVYRLGCFTLEPHRQLLRDGTPVLIGLKPLALLSVLASAEGDLVTKDELLAAVWPGTIVEENALHAQITGLRKLLGADADLLTTVRGLGYRLQAAPSGRPAAGDRPPTSVAAPRPTPPTHRRRIWVVAASALAILVLGSAGLWAVRAFHQRVPTGEVAILPFDTDGSAGTQSIAAGLPDQIAVALSELQIPVTSTEASSPGFAGRIGSGNFVRQADLIVQGTVTRVRSGSEVTAKVIDTRDRTVLWTVTISGDATSPAATQAIVASHLAEPIKWASFGLAGSTKLDPPSLASFVAGRGSMVGIRNAGAEISEYQRVVDQAPNFSWGYSGLATAEAYTAMDDPISASSARLRVAAVRAAKQALMIEPHNGEAYMAFEAALSRNDWVEREQFLLRGAAAEPSFEPATLMEGRLLWSVGRTDDGLIWLERAHSLNSIRFSPAWSLSLALASIGQIDEAHDVEAKTASQWPDTARAKLLPILIPIFAGRYQEALAALDHAGADTGLSPTQRTLWRLGLSATVSRDGALKRQASRAIIDAVSSDQIGIGNAVMFLAMIGDIDDAFVLARAYRTANPSTPPYLFVPPTARLRADSRFIGLAHRLGLVAYWKRTGRWPDFCADPRLSYDCRREAARYGG